MFDTSFLANPRYILFAISNVLLYSRYNFNISWIIVVDCQRKIIFTYTDV